MFSLILITIVASFVRSIYLTYLFQIKEYRFDRFHSYIKEEGILNIFYLKSNRIPALSIRNIMILVSLCFMHFILLLVALESVFIYYLLTIFVVGYPFVAYMLVSVAVILTSIPAWTIRSVTILFARLKVKMSRTIFIGITGSYGKTSVKEYVFHILSSKYRVAKTDNNMNTDIGVALSILRNLSHDTQYFVAEFGAYKKGEIKKASSYIPLSAAILTGLGNQHLDLYGSREALIEEESFLITTLNSNATAYILDTVPNRDEIIAKTRAEVVRYGMRHTGISARILEISDRGSKAQIRYRNHDLIITTHLLGEHSIENLLPAIAFAYDCGMSMSEIKDAVATLRPIKGKLSLHKGPSQSTIIHDGVNSNVDGFIAAIRILKRFPQRAPYIASQGIIELGGEKRSSYEKILKHIYEIDGCKLLTTDPLFKTLDTEDRVLIFNDVSSLYAKLSYALHKQSLLLIEGKFSPSFLKRMIISDK